MITQIIPIRPATKVLFRESAPKAASTVLDDISFNLVGNAPEFISSTNDVTSSLVNEPWIITSLAKALSTLAADKQWELLLPQPPLPFSALVNSWRYESVSSS